ncbi:acyltransferase, partial [Acinetobacter baumannii]|nr:acyltransferase [Acinetobacter baumannii]
EWRDKNTPILKQGFITNSVEIGSDVWIGRNVVICKGVKIGDGAVIGANAVITKNVNQYEVVVGNPGRVIKVRGE